MKVTKLSESIIRSFADSFAVAERGLDYFRRKKVAYVKCQGKFIISEVIGSRKYFVKIVLNNQKEIIDLSCDCPYSGDHCKHIVAVLYELLYNRDKYFSDETPFKELKKNDPTLLEIIDLSEIENNYSPEKILEAFALCEQVKIDTRSKYSLVAKVTEQKDYNVSLEIGNIYGMDLKQLRTKCDCLGYGYCYCKHIIAVVFAFLLKSDSKKKKVVNFKKRLEDKYNLQQLNFLNSAVSNFQFESIDERNYFLIFSAERNSDNKFSLCIQKSYTLKSGQQAQASSLTMNFLEKNKELFPASQKEIVDTLIVIFRMGGWYGTLIRSNFETIFDLQLLHKLRDLYSTQPGYFLRCSFSQKKINPLVNVEKNKEKTKGFSFKVIAKTENEEIPLEFGQTYLVNGKELWGFKFDPQSNSFFVFEIETKYPSYLRNILKYEKVQMKSEHLIQFIDTSYQKLSMVVPVTLPKEHEPLELTMEPKPRLFLKDYEKSFCMELRFLYDTRDVSSDDLQEVVFRDPEGKLKKIRRDIAKETEYISLLNQENVVKREGLFVPNVDPYVWLTDVLPKLSIAGFEIYGKQNLKNLKIRKEEAKLALHVSSGIDWFDLKGELSFGEEKLPLNSLLEALNKQERFVKLNDGSLGAIPKKWFEALSGVTGFLDSDKSEGTTRASVTQISIIESLLGIAGTSQTDAKFEEIKKRFKKFRQIKDVSLPKGLCAPLREYQKEGYNWLHFLKEFSFGGCLADEMGLGKTLQILTLLLSEKEQGNSVPSLIVVPRSLGFNWLAEIQKFTPNLKAYFHHGIDRPKTKKEILRKKVDLVITTYGTMRNDADILKQIKFHYIVLDESQQIKNFLSKSAKSAYSLKSSHRLALTGTPIENSSLELWAQFAFLNPGLLGNVEYFKNTFNKSIEVEKNMEKASSLKNIIHPFILLRKKEFVAKELPEKQITIAYCDMDSQQREVYEAWKEKFRNEIVSSIESEGMAKSRMKILKGLIILRQICNHPLLIDASYKGKSGKFDNLINNIQEILAGGHKILIFSSFVKMLKLFREYFDKEKINYSYLDGSTRDRKEVVEEFQSDENRKIFLISLKAGGLGLNLTSADYVFIVDPWWNPASEMQAIDRAHRIGQTKNVFVYKTIMKETVEEKILELQQSKLELVKNIITVDSHIFKNLTKDDIKKMFS